VSKGSVVYRRIYNTAVCRGW